MIFIEKYFAKKYLKIQCNPLYSALSIFTGNCCMHWVGGLFFLLTKHGFGNIFPNMKHGKGNIAAKI